MSANVEEGDYLPVNQWCVKDDKGDYHIVVIHEAERISGAPEGTRAGETYIDLYGERWVRADGSDQFISPDGQTAKRVSFVRDRQISTRP